MTITLAACNENQSKELLVRVQLMGHALAATLLGFSR
jgi:hypothetical protein